MLTQLRELERRPHSRCGDSRVGFTMVELIVVIGIIVLAAGMMTPSITEFFKNRQLEQISGDFRAAINRARLQAVNERTNVHLVFFREGIRVYSERTQDFIDEYFSPETSPLYSTEQSAPKNWYVLGFFDRKLNIDLPAYRDWEREHVPAVGLEGDDKKARKKTKRRERRGKRRSNSRRGRRGGSAGSESIFRLPIDTLPRITFLRDGSVNFTSGGNISKIQFEAEPPENADLIIYSKGNNVAGFIDLRPTGQTRSRTVAMTKTPNRPEDVIPAEEEEGRKGKRGRRGKRRTYRRS